MSVIPSASMHGPWNKETRRIVSIGQAREIFGDRPKTLIARHKSYRTNEGFRNVLKVDSLLWNGSEYPCVSGDETFWEDWSPLRLGDPDPRFGEVGFEIFRVDSAFAYQPTFGENPSFRGEPAKVRVSATRGSARESASEDR